MRVGVIGLGHLLYEVGRHTPGGVAAMMAVGGGMMMFAAIGVAVVFQAYQAVGVVMMGNDGNHQYQQTDEKQRSGYVSFPFHSFLF